jgi:hypothetical protein
MRRLLTRARRKSPLRRWWLALMEGDLVTTRCDSKPKGSLPRLRGHIVSRKAPAVSSWAPPGASRRGCGVVARTAWTARGWGPVSPGQTCRTGCGEGGDPRSSTSQRTCCDERFGGNRSVRQSNRLSPVRRKPPRRLPAHNTRDDPFGPWQGCRLPSPNATPSLLGCPPPRGSPPG